MAFDPETIRKPGEKMSERPAKKSIILLPVVLCIGLAAGLYIGSSINTGIGNPGTNSELQKLREVLQHINTEYVDEVDSRELTQEAIDAILSRLDPHSAFIPAEDRELANEDLRGNFDGIGIEFNIFSDTIVVVSPLSGGPSESLGIRAGDKIVMVNGEKVAGVGITSRRVMELLKGPRGTQVEVSIVRNGSPDLHEFTIIRDRIPQNSLDVAYMVDKETGYLKISRFSATTYDEFRTALAGLKEKGMKKLILDLQSNPGGYLQMAISIADEFLEDGSKIVYTHGKNTKFDSDANATAAGAFEKGDLIVLVNEGSASASEIVSGALQDNDRALIVGRRTYGKGLVQTQFRLSDDSELRLTISRYYTPSGRSIQKPYEDEEAYQRDIISRYNHGEFFHADSIRFSDSLRYETKGGRTVYGGGGIMPDYFVPLDTTMNSHYLNELYTTTSIQEYTFTYATSNETALKAKGFQDFYYNFNVSDAMLEEMAAVGQRNGVKPDRKELNEKRRLFQVHIKAQIARKLWGNEGYYPIMNETNEVFKQALKLFDKVPDKILRSQL